MIIVGNFFQHPFFIRDGDSDSVKRLICEVNAEQITTELVETDMDEDDDTSSSIDVNSGDVNNEITEVIFIHLFY